MKRSSRLFVVFGVAAAVVAVAYGYFDPDRVSPDRFAYVVREENDEIDIQSPTHFVLTDMTTRDDAAKRCTSGPSGYYRGVAVCAPDGIDEARQGVAFEYINEKIDEDWNTYFQYMLNSMLWSLALAVGVVGASFIAFTIGRWVWRGRPG